jgi:hypothetical protein
MIRLPTPHQPKRSLPFHTNPTLTDIREVISPASPRFTLHGGSLLVKACSDPLVRVECKMDDPVQLGMRVLRILHHLGIYSLNRHYYQQKQVVELYLLSFFQGNKSPIFLFKTVISYSMSADL